MNTAPHPVDRQTAGPGSLVEPLLARVVSRAIHLHRGDDLRRFCQLNEWPRSIHHYRELVGNARSHGALVSYPRGTILHLEAAPGPRGSTDELWFVVLDTSIGLPWTAWRTLQQRDDIRIEVGSVNSLEKENA